MLRSRGPGTVLALLLLAVSVGCKTQLAGFPSTATLRLQLADNGMTFQGADPKGFQATTWVVESARIHVASFGDFDFLGVQPCTFTDNVLLADDFARTCAGTGLILDADQPVVGELRVVISSMLARSAVQPVLDPEVDTDGDGLINRNDNCPLIPNPLQDDINVDGDGDACSVADSTGGLTIRDSDKDGFPDGIDNCSLVANTDQRDVFRGADLIGDVCEQFTEVALPNGGLTLSFPVAFDPEGPRFELLRVDFNSQIAVHCDAARTTCKVIPEAIELTQTSG